MYPLATFRFKAHRQGHFTVCRQVLETAEEAKVVLVIHNTRHDRDQLCIYKLC